jgi:hypothetical protein
MAAIPYTRQQLIQALRRHINNGWPTTSYPVTANELTLYIDRAIAFNIVGKAWESAKLTGVMEVPEAFLITYQLLNITQDPISGYWLSTLPQPPVSLPLGYSITRVYPANSQYGEGNDFLPVKAKRTAYRQHLPVPPGGHYKVENGTVYLKSNDNSPLLGIPFYVVMPTSRTSDITQNMNLPDDIIITIWDSVIAQLTNRLGTPIDIVTDYLPAGSTDINTPGR